MYHLVRARARPNFPQLRNETIWFTSLSPASCALPAGAFIRNICFVGHIEWPAGQERLCIIDGFSQSQLALLVSGHRIHTHTAPHTHRHSMPLQYLYCGQNIRLAAGSCAGANFGSHWPPNVLPSCLFACKTWPNILFSFSQRRQTENKQTTGFA